MPKYPFRGKLTKAQRNYDNHTEKKYLLVYLSNDRY